MSQLILKISEAQEELRKINPDHELLRLVEIIKGDTRTLASIKDMSRFEKTYCRGCSLKESLSQYLADLKTAANPPLSLEQAYAI